MTILLFSLCVFILYLVSRDQRITYFRCIAFALALVIQAGCVSKPRPYIPDGSRLNGGDVQFYRWASR